MHSLDKDATIYHFTLLRKIHHRLLAMLLYAALPVGIAMYLTLNGSIWDCLPMVAGLLLLPWMYGGITFLYLRQHDHTLLREWALLYRPPWLGMLPRQHAAIQTMLRIHRQLVWVGLAIIACLYPWLGLQWCLLVGMMHLWLLAPASWMLTVFRKANKNGFIRISLDSTGYYIQ